MEVRGLRNVSLMVIVCTIPVLGGCASCWTSSSKTTMTTSSSVSCKSPRGSPCNVQATTSAPQVTTRSVTVTAMADLPPNAQPGECYARAFVPAKFETMTEQVVVREASERIEIVPAQYEWVEEKVMVKDASTQLEEVPAEFEWREDIVEVEQGHTGWVLTKGCIGQPARDVFCLLTRPPVTKTVRTQCLVKPASVREVAIPAQYETIRREKLVSGATTRKICTPAEFETIEKSVKVAEATTEWQRVICEIEGKAETVNAIKGALLAEGYETGPLNGEFGETDRLALTEYQESNGLAIGELSYETMEKLGVPAP